jgi:hypothetical protein
MRHILELKDEESKVIHISVDPPEKFRPANFRVYPKGVSGHLACHKIVFDLVRDMDKFFIMRDPRDIIVSWAHYSKRVGDHHALARLHRIDASLNRVVRIKGADDRIMVLINAIRPYMTGFLDWPKYAHTVRYEGLINDPATELAGVAAILDEPLDELVERAGFRGGKTFRKGMPGEWKHEFTDEHNEVFWENFADVMERWNYT